MIREILDGDFMDNTKVQKICMKAGFSKYQIRSMKREEGIKTVEIENGAGEKIWLWYCPRDIWEKYSEREAD